MDKLNDKRKRRRLISSTLNSRRDIPTKLKIVGKIDPTLLDGKPHESTPMTIHVERGLVNQLLKNRIRNSIELDDNFVHVKCPTISVDCNITLSRDEVRNAANRALGAIIKNNQIDTNHER